MSVHKKYRASFFKRLTGAPPQTSCPSPSVWIHAVSVGETRAAAGLVKKFRTLGYTVIFSSGTETGHREAKKTLEGVQFFVYLPFDFAWSARRMLRWARPVLLIFIETDLWFQFLRQAHKTGTKIVVVNGKISAKSTRLYQLYRTYARRLFEQIDLLLLQSKEYASRYQSVGVPPEKMHVTGNLKLDLAYAQSSEKELQRLKKKYQIVRNDFVIVLGSTHTREEVAILEQLKGILCHSEVKILVVPRHPERFERVSIEIKNQFGTEQVKLVGEMGVLTDCFQLASIAILGGSFFPGVGGHNVIEPCAYQTPVLFGPYMDSQKQLVELVLKYGAGKQLPIEKVREAVTDWYSNRDALKKRKRHCRSLKQVLHGPLENTWEKIPKKVAQ